MGSLYLIQTGIFLKLRSEGEVVVSCFRSGRRGEATLHGCLRGSCRCLSGSGKTALGECLILSGGCLSGCTFLCRLRFPATDAGEPSAVVFAALDIEAQTNHVAHIERELVGTVTEEIKMNFLGETLVGFQHIFAFVPVVAVFRHTALRGEGQYDFACYFHVDFYNLLMSLFY